MSVIAGIDPGLKGGIAALSEHEHIAIPMPLVGKEVDVSTLVAFLRGIKVDLVVIEKAQSMPKQSSQSGFNYGVGYGDIRGGMKALGIPYVEVRPTAWKKLVLAGTKRDKSAAVEFVARRYPVIDLIPEGCRKPHDGIADAVCLAHYGIAKGNEL